MIHLFYIYTISLLEISILYLPEQNTNEFPIYCQVQFLNYFGFFLLRLAWTNLMEFKV